MIFHSAAEGIVKDQYFGDVNDFRKYGLLRVLAGSDRLRLGVCWMLTARDAALFDWLRQVVGEEKIAEPPG